MPSSSFRAIVMRTSLCLLFIVVVARADTSSEKLPRQRRQLQNNTSGPSTTFCSGIRRKTKCTHEEECRWVGREGCKKKGTGNDGQQLQNNISGPSTPFCSGIRRRTKCTNEEECRR